MKLTITFRCVAQSRNDLIHTFAKEFRAYKSTMEQAHALGSFGDPALVQLRFVAIGGLWDDSVKPYIPNEQGVNDDGDSRSDGPDEQSATSAGNDESSRPDAGSYGAGLDFGPDSQPGADPTCV